MKTLLIILGSIFISCCPSIYYYRSEMLSEIFDAKNRIDSSYSKEYLPINDKRRLYFSEKSRIEYQETFKKICSTEGIKEITGIPDSTDSISKVAELALLALEPWLQNGDNLMFINSKSDIKRLYYYGNPIFYGDINKYHKIIKECLGVLKWDIEIEIKKINSIQSIQQPFIFWHNQNPLYIVLIDRYKKYRCGREREKLKLYISQGKNGFEIEAVNILEVDKINCKPKKLISID